jgi:hypothetical protein
MVMIIFPAFVVVSAHGSDNDWSFPSACRIVSISFKEIAGRAGQAIKFPDNDCVASANLIEHSLKLSTIAGAGGNLLLEYSPTSCLL